MKELSIEEKAKRYDDALERAKFTRKFPATTSRTRAIITTTVTIDAITVLLLTFFALLISDLLYNIFHSI